MMLFGSFTEEDVKLLQNQSDQKTNVNSSDKADSHHATKKIEIELKFGSFDTVPFKSVKGIHPDSNQTASIAKPKDTQTPSLVAKDAASSKIIGLQKTTKPQVTVAGNDTTLINGKSLFNNDAIAKPKDIQSPSLVAKDAALSKSNVLQKTTKPLETVNGNDTTLINGKSSLNNDVIAKPKDIQSSSLVAEDAALGKSIGLQKSTEPQETVSGNDKTLIDGKFSSNDYLKKTTKPQANGIPNGCSSNYVKSSYGTNSLDSNSNSNLDNKKLLPRGLINSGNLCFLNAMLQALLSCPPFVQFLQDLAKHNIPKVGYPTLQAFVGFISEFGIPKDDDTKEKKQERRVIETGKPFSATMFNPLLDLFTPDIPSSLSCRPRQEDAQEFLSFAMDRMHNELLKLEGNVSNSNDGNLALVSSSEDDGWETVGPKNKTSVTRTQSFIPSELSAIFGGQLRSTVKSRGHKASVTVQPYLLLHLDILSDAIHNIEDALHLFSAPESLEGYKASAGKAEVVSASKSVKIQKLSKILILHLMRFSYGNRGSKKLHKSVQFPLELVIARDLLVIPTSEGRKYELVATITHHGQEPSKGHYTADSKYSNGQWLRYDDSSIFAVGTNKVLHDQAYLLFYKQL